MIYLTAILSIGIIPLTVGWFFGKNHVDPNKPGGREYYADYQDYDFT